MCGIFGYVGEQEGVDIVIEGLKRLEYRGYDSAGVAALRGDELGIRRSVGKLKSLQELLELNPLPGAVAVGHTRWATHGIPSEINAHPHADCKSELAVVHNGIIENYAPLKEQLQAEGHVFRSQTDTEVLAHLIERRLKAAGDLLAAVRGAMTEVHGAYALAVVWRKAPGKIVCARMQSPLVVGLGSDGTYLASDVPAFLKRTRRAVYLEDGEVAVLERDGASFYDPGGKKVERAALHVQWDSGTAEKGGYRHFMLKEIHEQSRAVENTLRGRLLPLNDGILERETGLPKSALAGVKQIHIVACGTAYHAGLIGKYLLESYAGIPTQVETASEYRYRRAIIPPGTLVIAISQSGETADTIAAAKLAREAGAKVLSVCNTLGASLTRSSHYNFYTHCGPECGVASTKAFVGQLVAMSLLTLHLGVATGGMSEKEGQQWVAELKRLPSLIEQALKLDGQVQAAGERFAKASSCLFIGRTLNYPTAIEGALKLKEISYIHAEGYPAGEMKHGPLALVDDKLPVVAIATESPVFEKVLSNVEEARARGGRILALVTEGETRLDGKCDVKLELPRTLEFLSPAVNIVPLQLLSYHIAVARGCDVDQPRNLAKSVTVE